MDQDDGIELRVGFTVEDAAITALHGRAFGASHSAVVPWAARLERHSVAWVGAFQEASLVGFVHAVWDGGEHAFLLDTVVDPAMQRRGIGLAMISRLREATAAAGCTWLHVDFEPHLADFYRSAGFRPSDAGVLRLR